MQPGKDSRFEPERWDEGITALLLNYSLSAGRNEQTINNDRRTNNNLFANAQLGANAGAWRVRSTITHSHSDADGEIAWRVTTVTTRVFPLRIWRVTLLPGAPN